MAAVGTDNAQVPDTGKAAAAATQPSAAAVRRAQAIRHRRALRRPSDRLTWPIHGAISGGFDEQRAGHVHVGIDIPAPAGSPIRAASAGRVTLRGFEQGYGKYTCIAHRTITTCYGHQSRFGTTIGAKVRRGQVIGYVGNTGDTDAYHLHFEIRRGARPWGTPVNPVRHLPQRQGAR